MLRVFISSMIRMLFCFSFSSSTRPSVTINSRSSVLNEFLFSRWIFSNSAKTSFTLYSFDRLPISSPILSASLCIFIMRRPSSSFSSFSFSFSSLNLFHKKLYSCNCFSRSCLPIISPWAAFSACRFSTFRCGRNSSTNCPIRPRFSLVVSILRKARSFLIWYCLTPAASSITYLLSSGVADNTASAIPWLMMAWLSLPTPALAKTSTISCSLTREPLIKYSPSPLRNIRRDNATSENSKGIFLSLLSKKSVTWALPNLAFFPEPAKIISSAFLPRRFFIDCSPITQRIASAMLDLPEPFGPTIAVTRGTLSSPLEKEKSNTVLLANDLKPLISIFFRNIFYFSNMIQLFVPTKPLFPKLFRPHSFALPAWKVPRPWPPFHHRDTHQL